MVAYTGNIKFEREGMLSKGIGNLLKKTMSGEGTTMMRTSEPDVYMLPISRKE